MRQVLWLVKNGVPLDVAARLPADERFGWAVVFSEFEGQRFDWDAGAWAQAR